MTVTASVSAPKVVFDHLEGLSDDRGLFEHALHDVPRHEHGYCVDDAARGVIVLCREPMPSRNIRVLLRRYLDLVVDAVESDGRCHNRMAADRRWTDEPATGDWWGRAVWALGAAGVGASSEALRTRAMRAFRRAAQARSPHLHAMAFAALGAAEVLGVRSDDCVARDLLVDAVAAIGPLGPHADWPWPEPTLRYGNAALAEALVVGGHLLDEPAVLAQGLTMLTFLIATETHAGHLSVTPVAGRRPGSLAPGFDQQPIEVAAIADACATAWRITSDPAWLAGVALAWSWFLGDNDSGVVMFEPTTGAGYDGLEPGGRNDNRGAESTLAMLSTAQLAVRLSRHL
jgi:hypothetical protein